MLFFAVTFLVLTFREFVFRAAATQCDSDLSPLVRLAPPRHVEGRLPPLASDTKSAPAPPVVALSPFQLLADESTALRRVLSTHPKALFVLNLANVAERRPIGPGEQQVGEGPGAGGGSDDELGLTDVERLVEQLARRGNWVGIDLGLEVSSSADAIDGIMRGMGGIIEGVIGVPPMIVLPPENTKQGDDLLEQISNQGYLALLHARTLRDVSEINEAAEPDESEPVHFESILSSSQRRCAFARFECDYTAPHELLYRTCSRLREVHLSLSFNESVTGDGSQADNSKEAVDLFKFASLLTSETGSELTDSSVFMAQPGFLEENKVRVEIAYRSVARGSNLADVMKSLFTISDQTVRTGEEAVLKELSQESENFWVTVQRSIGLIAGIVAILVGLRPTLANLITHGQAIAHQGGRSALSRAGDIGKTL